MSAVKTKDFCRILHISVHVFYQLTASYGTFVVYMVLFLHEKTCNPAMIF